MPAQVAVAAFLLFVVGALGSSTLGLPCLMCLNNCSADAPVCCGCGATGVCRQDGCPLACPTLSCQQHDGSCPAVVNNPDVSCLSSSGGTCSSDGDCETEEKCCAQQCGAPTCVSACEPPSDCPDAQPPPGCLVLDQLDANNCPLCPVVDCPKAGSCPAAPPNADVDVPVFACSTDSDCSGTLKCCADMWSGRRCVEPDLGETVCPVASGTSCSMSTPACSDDSQCADGSKCCTDACNVARCQRACTALNCPLPPMGPDCVLVQAAPDRYGCQTECPQVQCLLACNSSLPCDAGSSCFESQRCGNLSQGWGCGVERGDFLCHQTCVVDTDCPYSMPQCNEVVIWSADAAVLQHMCFTCPIPDCPVANIQPGCEMVAAFGYNGCRQCDNLVCDNRGACTPPICTEPAPTFMPPLCYWNTLHTDNNRCPACSRVSCLNDCLAGDPDSRDIQVACNSCTCSSFTGKIVCPTRTCSSVCSPYFTSCISCVCSRGALACTHSCPGELLFRLVGVPNMTIPMLGDFIFDWSKDFAWQPRLFGYEIRFQALSAMLSVPLPPTPDDADAVTSQLRAYFAMRGFSQRLVVVVPATNTPAPGPVVLDTAGGGALSPGAVAAVAVSVATVVALAAMLVAVLLVRRRRQAVIHIPTPAAVAAVAPTPSGSEVSEEAHDFL